VLEADAERAQLALPRLLRLGHSTGRAYAFGAAAAACLLHDDEGSTA
jgi:hypothetical protein